MLAQRLDRRLDRAYAQCNVRIARVLLPDVHQHILAATVCVRVKDEIQLDAVRVFHHRDGVIGSLVLELEAEHGVELHRAIEILHAHADVVDRRDVNALQFSSLKPIAWTILLHFACSAARNFAYSCGVLGAATPLTLANCSTTVDERSAFSAAAWMRFWTSAGVAAGTIRPYQLSEVTF